MKNCSLSAICVLLQLLGLLNFVSSVSTCTILGDHVYETGEQPNLKCVGGTGQRLEWTLSDNSQITNNRITITQKDNTSTLAMDDVALDDSATFRCKCPHHFHDHRVLPFKANMQVSMDVTCCQVSIMLEFTVVSKDHTNLSFTSFDCPTLGRESSRSWIFPWVPGHHGEHVMHFFADGNSGEANHTCHFTAVYKPNGSNTTRNFSKTATGDASCSEQNTRFKCTYEEDKTAALSSSDTSRKSSAVSKAYGLHYPQARSEMVLQLVLYCILCCNFIDRSHEW